VLAYVFWHWRRDGVPADRYRDLLRDFHASLERRRPSGFLGSSAFEIPGASWIPQDGPAVEDWYLLEGSAALDLLDRGAVEAPHQSPHDTVAAAAAGGAGGLYRLRAGRPLGGEARFALWFGKPEGMSYAALYALLEPRTSSGETLWGRQMVLGPAAEFCLHARSDAPLPAPIAAVTVPLRPLFPRS
jgi:hypothetical protein